MVLYVHVGDYVTFTWNVDGNSHTLSSADPTWSFDTGIQTVGYSVTYRFVRTGMFPFYDKMNPSLFGTVYVDLAGPSPISLSWGQGSPLGLVSVVPVGTTVTWILDLDLLDHTITHTATTPLFQSSVLHATQSYSFTFNQIGVYPYHDELNNGLFGQISVIPVGQSVTTPTTTVTTQPTTTRTTSQPTTTTKAPIFVSWPMTNSICINIGDVVVWELNVDNKPHTITSADTPVVFDSGRLAAGATFVFKFETLGLFAYYDKLNPNNFTGLVVVVSPGSEASTTAMGASTTKPSVAPSAFVSWGATGSAIVTTIYAGQSVRWTLDVDQAAHTITDMSGLTVNSPTLQPGQSYSYRFLRPGRYIYWDRFNHRIAGIVNVLPSSAQPTPAATSTATTTVTVTTTPQPSIWTISWPSTGVAISIKINDYVQWNLNVDSYSHAIIEEQGPTNSGNINPGESFLLRFSNPGLYIFDDASGDAYCIVIVANSSARRRSLSVAELTAT